MPERHEFNTDGLRTGYERVKDELTTDGANNRGISGCSARGRAGIGAANGASDGTNEPAVATNELSNRLTGIQLIGIQLTGIQSKIDFSGAVLKLDLPLRANISIDQDSKRTSQP